jgi:Predicted nucleic acid-binding protein, contains PIN domain
VTDLYDTCVLVDYWKGDAATISLIDAVRNRPKSASYSPLSATELWQYPNLSRREEIEYVALTRYFLQEAPLSTMAAIEAGQWLRDYSRSARMRLAADTLIAATAKERGERVRTRNCKDTQKFYSDVQAY